ncbi:MAG: ATP-grasp domain-containing protein [Gammaproteobacteria bacterium]|nr:ATP-grasp domain-containing protein [Gammaproteobacteria bacterium]
MPNYLVVATSGRAIAQGLKSLGYSVAVVDGFADCDTVAAATEIRKVKRSSFGLNHNEVLQTVQSLQSKIPFDGLFFDAAMESNPNLLDEINVNPIFGNSSQVLSACKNFKVFFSILDQHSIPYPEISFKPITGDNWLVKQAVSTGGIGVAPASEEVAFTENSYLQRKVDGINFSLTFLANGEELFELGFNTLWSEQLGLNVPYAYAGAINQVRLDAEIQMTALQYAKIITKEFELVGLNSIDFICVDKSVYVLEVNPRIPASYELYETKYGDLMAQHIEVCKSRTLPATKIQPLLRAHAIVYAPADINVSESVSWPLWTADRPHAHVLIKKFEPVCSIFAGGKNSAQVYEMIKTRKQSILANLAQ